MNPLHYFLLPIAEASSEYSKLYWIIRLRWLAIGWLSLMAPIGLITHILNYNSIATYIGFIGLLFCFNVLSQAIWFKKNQKIHPLLVALQLSIDLFIFVGLILLTGGITNPFYVFIFVHIFLGATLLNGRHGFVFLILCHQALAVVQAGSYFSMIGLRAGLNEASLIPFAIQHCAVLVAWFVSYSLGRAIQYQNNKLLNVQIFAEKMDRLRAIGAMAAGFSHEFASPLNTVKLRLERELRKNPESENLLEMQISILECELVIKQMNSSQMDPRSFDFQTLNLNKLTDDILHSWQNENPQAEILKEIHAKNDVVKIPSLNFSQALINILDNALEASPHGRISVQTNSDESILKLQIHNEGSKFSSDILSRFGEPFLTTKKTGTGLGLYSVQLFSQIVGGSTELKNTSTGAQVTLHIPILNKQDVLHA